MAKRVRIWAFGSAGLLALAGVIGGLVIGGLTGQLLALVLVSIGLGGAVLLVFLEVGLSEDRARAREAARRPERARPTVPGRPKPRMTPRWPRRPG